MEVLKLANALSVVYEYGFELTEESFVELTYEQYASLEGQGEDISGRRFRISRGIFEERNNPPAELSVVNEAEKERLLRAVQLVYRMSEKSDRSFRDFRDRLAWLRDRLPPAITGHPESDTPPPKPHDPPRDPPQEPEEPSPERVGGEAPAGVRQLFDRITALQDEGHVEAARDQLIEVIRWQSRLEVQLEAVKLLARRPTHRTLHYLKHIYRSTHVDTEDGRRIVYPEAPQPLGEAMAHPLGKFDTPAHLAVWKALQRTHEELARQAATGSRKELDDLVRVVSPPEAPVDSGPEDGDVWRDVEFRLGLDLPIDFKQLVRVYGSGGWGGYLRMLNPFSGDPGLNLERRAHDLLAQDHVIRRRFPDQIPFALYPEKDGLFPWAVLSNDVRLCYLTEGPVESWQMIVYGPGGLLYDRYRTSTTDFLFRFVSGATPGRVLGPLRQEHRWTFLSSRRGSDPERIG